MDSKTIDANLLEVRKCIEREKELIAKHTARLEKLRRFERKYMLLQRRATDTRHTELPREKVDTRQEAPRVQNEKFDPRQGAPKRHRTAEPEASKTQDADTIIEKMKHAAATECTHWIAPGDPRWRPLAEALFEYSGMVLRFLPSPANNTCANAIRSDLPCNVPISPGMARAYADEYKKDLLLLTHPDKGGTNEDFDRMRKLYKLLISVE